MIFNFNWAISTLTGENQPLPKDSIMQAVTILITSFHAFGYECLGCHLATKQKNSLHFLTQ